MQTSDFRRTHRSAIATLMPTAISAPLVRPEPPVPFRAFSDPLLFTAAAEERRSASMADMVRHESIMLCGETWRKFLLIGRVRTRWRPDARVTARF